MPSNYTMVTGASSGIGAACCKVLATSSRKVILIGRDSDRLAKVVEGMVGGPHKALSLDLENEDSVASLIKDLKEQDIRLDGLVCCAGAHQVKPLRITKSQDYYSLFSSNVLTVTNVLSRACKLMNPGSGVVLVGSAAIYRGATAVSAYAAAKSALNGVMRAAALEMAPNDIRVNVIAPGVVRTEMTEAFLDSLGDEAAREVVERHPLGIGETQDVTGLIDFLLSQEARWLTGQTIAIDGGFSIAG